MDGKQETVTENSVFTLSELNKTLEFHCNTLSHICLWHYISGKKKKIYITYHPSANKVLSVCQFPWAMPLTVNCAHRNTHTS